MDQSEFILRMAAFLLLLTPGTDCKLEMISSETDVEVGASHLLLCKAGGEVDITWQKDGVDIDDERVKKIDETSSKLVIDLVKMDDAGRYTCMCEYNDGHKDDVSYRLYVYEGPSFGSTPVYHEFLEGQAAVVVSCLVSGRPAVEVRWLRDGQELPSDGRIDRHGPRLSCEGQRMQQLANNSLRIKGVRREDSGSYVCRANIKGRPPKKEITVSIVINTPPTVRFREEVKKVLAGPETNVSLLCLVDGLPKPNITWNMPVNFDPFRHKFNSDRSELTILAVARGDYGEYICTAENQIGESNATIMLHVSEAPEVWLSAEQRTVSLGQSVSVSCNVSGHPSPQLHWLSKKTGHTLDSVTGRVRVSEGVLVIDDVAPSDGGLYSCMAASQSGNASRDFALNTEPSPPMHLSVSPGPTSIHFSLLAPSIDGGTPITSYALQWRTDTADQWEETMVQASEPLFVTSLKPYSSYRVRLAAVNAVGRGEFSSTHTLRTQGIREPDRPVLLSNQKKLEGNSFSVPLSQLDDGGTPLLHYSIRYRQDKEREEWKEKQLSSNATSIYLPELMFGTDYHLEVRAVNVNGSSSPTEINFTVPQQAVKVTKPGITKGGVAAIIMVIFLVLLLAVDATCCYTNRCGLLMFLAVKVFGQKAPGLKTLEEGDGPVNGEVKLKGLSAERGGGSEQQPSGALTQEGRHDTEVTCDKAPLTRYKKNPANGDLPTTDA